MITLSMVSKRHSGFARRSHKSVEAITLNCLSRRRFVEATWAAPVPSQRASERPACTDEKVWDQATLRNCTEQIARKARFEDDVGLCRSRSPRLITRAMMSRGKGRTGCIIRRFACARAGPLLVRSVGSCCLSSAAVIGFVRQWTAPEDNHRSVGKGPARDRVPSPETMRSSAQSPWCSRWSFSHRLGSQGQDRHHSSCPLGTDTH